MTTLRICGTEWLFHFDHGNVRNVNVQELSKDIHIVSKIKQQKSSQNII